MIQMIPWRVSDRNTNIKTGILKAWVEDHHHYLRIMHNADLLNFTEKAHVIPSMKLLQGVGFLQRLNLEPDSLLGLCNEARSYLDDQKTLEPRSRITRLLRDILYCEKHYPPAIPFETIQEAHIDKLLTELMKRENTAKTSSYAVIAHSLERKWSLRFRERYFDIDQLRYEALSRDGMLRNVVFNQQAKCNRRLWQAEKMSALSEAEGNLRFEPGE